MKLRSCEPWVGHRKQHRRRGIVITCGLVAVLVVAPSSGGADVAPAPLLRAPTSTSAFPGQNGLIGLSRHDNSTGNQIYVVRPDGTGLRKLTSTGGRNPSFSPDGSRLAFESRGGAIVVARADGTHARTVVLGREPDWSPDGRRLVYGCGGICVINVDGTRMRVLVKSAVGGLGEPKFSPDGTLVAFSRFFVDLKKLPQTIKRDIYVVPARGGRARPLVRGDDESGVDVSSWSPDATRLAYIANGKIGIVDRNGNRIRSYPLNGGWRGALTYSPDGRQIAYWDGGGWIRLLSLDTGTSTLITRAPGGGVSMYIFGLTWQPVRR